MKKILGLILAISIFIVGCGDKKENPVEEKKIVKNVEVNTVQTREMSKLFDSSSVWEPLNKIDFSTNKGGTVEKIYKRKEKQKKV